MPYRVSPAERKVIEFGSGKNVRRKNNCTIEQPLGFTSCFNNKKYHFMLENDKLFKLIKMGVIFWSF